MPRIQGKVVAFKGDAWKNYYFKDMNIMHFLILEFPFGNALCVSISPIFTNIFPFTLD